MNLRATKIRPYERFLCLSATVISLSFLCVGTSSAQEFYNVQDSGSSAPDRVIRDGGIGQDLRTGSRAETPAVILESPSDQTIDTDAAGVSRTEVPGQTVSSAEGGQDNSIGLDVGDAQGSSFSPLSLLARKPFRINISVREGFDDNVNTTRTNRQSSLYTNFAAGISYDFGGPRLKLSTRLSGGYTFYSGTNVSRPDRFSGLWNLSAMYMVSPKLILTATTNTGYYSQPNLIVTGTNVSQQGDYFSSSTSFAALYQWATRFSSTTSYSFSTLYYMDPDINENQGRITQTFGQSINFMWKPTTTLVAEYRVSPTTYFDADLNTLNQYGLVGFDHVFSPRSSWNMRVGAQFNFLNNPVDGTGTYFGPYGESAFIYNFAERSSVAWTLRYGTEASGLNNVTQRQTFRTGLGFSHGFTPRLKASLGLYYNVSYFNQANVINPYYQTSFEGAAGLTYELNRFLSASVGYRYTGVYAPEAQSQEYTRNVVFVGLNAGF